MSSISTEVRAQLAPHGVLSAAVYLGNFLLVTGRTSAGEPTGIAPDICRAVAKRLEVPLELTGYESQEEVVEAAASGRCGIVLVGSDPARAEKVTFTPAYVELEATYLVSDDSPIQDIFQVDQPGVRIASFFKSAYDHWLQRNLKHGTLVHADSLQASNELFLSERLDALAGLKTGLVAFAKKHPGLRILEGQFTGIQQAIATKKSNLEAITFLSTCVEEFIRSGLVADLIRQYQLQGLAAAPINQNSL
ncbi:transporter substrate-binding domain-containing protein [Polynucleobacter sp. JS-Safj-400b-B2]|uniref:transporter substrate-binding domain-containing protein n=1 Tax=Polynucleobacter sp. JS-Safj-400b-B2 TaxID=2576921 RepID=UPI001C0DC0D9|nr:transporter substrate-binding domain-containing protein [Polynucleobacter sp. JS-Safj-400b-B2]MBU3626533.1 transporter substrate-binding domain-containing protein [Polynucleobacter sp. JS-Safj-400b-B2]